MTQPTVDQDRYRFERGFIERLAKLERGPLAELRRSLGDDTPGDSAQFLEGVMVRSGMKKGHYNRQAVYLVAGLYALIERPHDDETPNEAAARMRHTDKSLGSLLGSLHTDQNVRSGRKPSDSSSIEKRFLALLDADTDALPYQLRQAVSLLKGSDIKPDWARLLSDVSSWNADWGNQVRRRWAEDFYRTAADTPTNNPQASTPSEDTQ